jgi:hypothetical protein
MIIIGILIAMIIYVIWGCWYMLRQLHRLNNKDVLKQLNDDKKVPDHGSYDDLIKYRRGRSKH